MGATRVEGSAILYTTTDLGSGFFKFETRPDGSTYGLTRGEGTVTYAFDKSPTKAIDVVTLVGDPDYYVDFKRLTFQNGDFQVGSNRDTNFYDEKQHQMPQGYDYPTFEPHDTKWNTAGGQIFPPILDLNSRGQAVGEALKLGGSANIQNNDFAAFSAVGLTAHGGDASIEDNLNNHIASIPGITLTSAFFIDDLGRIIASGSNTRIYILTPISLGGVETVPEPTALAVFGMAGLILATRRARLRVSHS